MMRMDVFVSNRARQSVTVISLRHFCSNGAKAARSLETFRLTVAKLNESRIPNRA